MKITDLKGSKEPPRRREVITVELKILSISWPDAYSIKLSKHRALSDKTKWLALKCIQD
jgi:hypothetical protein